MGGDAPSAFSHPLDGPEMQATPCSNGIPPAKTVAAYLQEVAEALVLLASARFCGFEHTCNGNQPARPQPARIVPRLSICRKFVNGWGH